MTTEHPSNDPAFLAAYGAVIRQVREQHGLDRKELAEAAGISYSYLSAIESGQKLPSGTVQDVLATSLQTTPAELLASANGALEVETDVRASMTVSDAYRAMPAARDRGFIGAAARMKPTSAGRDPLFTSEPGVSTSGALAELRALVPNLSPEDAAMVVAMARRLAGSRRESSRTHREREHRGSNGRQLRTEAYLEFWTSYVDTLNHRGLDWAHGRRAEPRSYFTTPSPIRGASLSASFARNRLLRHEMYINRGSRSANLELLRQLEAKRTLIEKTYGHALEFEDPGRERRAVRIAEYREGHISRNDEWGDYIDWFIDRGEAARRAIDAYLAAS